MTDVGMSHSSILALFPLISNPLNKKLAVVVGFYWVGNCRCLSSSEGKSSLRVPVSPTNFILIHIIDINTEVGSIQRKVRAYLN